MSERVLKSGRNSRAREITRGAIQATVKKLHEVAPWLTPNQITIGGVIGVGGVALYAERANKVSKPEDTVLERSAVAAIYTAICLSDGLDGALERHLQALDHSRKSTQFGANLDAGSDRVQEALLASSRIATADYRNDKLGKALAIGALVTNSLPSLARAYGESRGIVFEENGNNWFQFFGTRLGRAISGGFSTLSPEFKGIPVQKTVDALTIASNISTTASRLKRIITSKESDSVLPQEEKDAAKTRLKMLAGIQVGAMITAFGLSRNRKAA